jgi:hypothetical protein
MPNSQIADFVAHVRDGVSQQLDKVSDIVPEQKMPRNAPPTFEDYHVLAQQHMQAHPEDNAFKDNFTNALAQYRAAAKR